MVKENNKWIRRIIYVGIILVLFYLFIVKYGFI